ncbi:MAG: GNAT family N-acetyltransferase [Nanoarchaeota archaeon]|nr:GNAT family N-acetyltransferase [Nanoarchaeota archaeon]
MELKKLETVGNEFNLLWDIMVEAFPVDERHSKNTQEEMFDLDNYTLYGAYNTELLGFSGVWNFETFQFIEHLAVRKEMRGKGYGTQIMSQLLKEGLVVLEVEPPVDEQSKKRIRFYENLGFHLNQYEYIQPAYEPTTKPVPLLIMSYPRPIDLSEFETIRERLHREVYDLKEPLLSLD